MAILPLLCMPPHPKPSLLALGQAIAEARYSDKALHHHLHLGQIVLFTAWRCIWDHGSVWKKKKKDCPTKSEPDGMACYCSPNHAGSVYLPF